MDTSIDYPQTRLLAKPYFIIAYLLLALQTVFGLILSTQYLWGDFLFPWLPFNSARMVHSNLLLFWLIFAFMGSAYYLVPRESQREIIWPKLTPTLFYALLLVTVATILSYLLIPYARLAELSLNETFPTMGREFLEQPTLFKMMLTLILAAFILQIGGTLLKGRRTAITTLLFVGLWGLLAFYGFAFYNPDNLVLDKFFWWWIFHLWVEVVWELILAGIAGFLIYRLTGVERQIIEKWLYVIMTTTVITGFVGTGHHYYWIGTQESWQWWGTIFSSLEPAPFFLLMIFVFNMSRRRVKQHPNVIALRWLQGATIMSFIGVGVFGFLPTLAPINYYTHGSQVTPAHGHMAFFGAYAMAALAMAAYALPEILKHTPSFGIQHEKQETWAFWLMNLGMVGITIFLTIAGLGQILYQRLGEDPLSFMETQEKLAIFYQLRLGSGIVFALGVLLLLWIYGMAAFRSNKNV
ncbi:cbb3-type cytochrome c oxidase subunit I [Magnetococcales bacterium HHB-1]